MNQAIFQSILVFSGIIFQVLLAPYLHPFGYKLNWVLMILVILAFQQSNRLMPFLAIFAGICCEVFSHGMFGVYGISFLFVILLTHWLSAWFYSHTLLLMMILFFVLTLLEGFFSLTLLEWSQDDIRWSWNLINMTLPLALIHAFVGPFLLKGVIYLENFGVRAKA